MADESKKKSMPKGVKKGGARYPRYSLEDALAWAKRLVAKAHLGPVPQDIVFASVVDSKSVAGEIRVSALKQYGLMQGTSQAYEPTPLAKAINAAPDDEAVPLLQQAALQPAIFKKLFDTFHGDEVNRAKLRQRAAELQVHPELTEQCVEIYVSALVFSKLGTVEGDKVTHRHGVAAASTSAEPDESDEAASKGSEGEREADAADEVPEVELRGPPPKAVFQVNVSLDASLDTDKLERQLALLKRYGAI